MVSKDAVRGSSYTGEATRIGFGWLSDIVKSLMAVKLTANKECLTHGRVFVEVVITQCFSGRAELFGHDGEDQNQEIEYKTIFTMSYAVAASCSDPKPKQEQRVKKKHAAQAVEGVAVAAYHMHSKGGKLKQVHLSIENEYLLSALTDDLLQIEGGMH
ncbi:hypothetical protein Ancab_023435 [Ancistrocladus abbreviatus]